MTDGRPYRDGDGYLDDPYSFPSVDELGPVRPASSFVVAEFGHCSDPGRQRTTNADHYLIVRLGRHQETVATSLPDGVVPPRFDEYGYGMVVADGVGADGSELASRLAISTLAELVLRFGRWNVRVNESIAREIVQRAERFYRQVGQRVTREATQHPSLAGMGTTLTAFFSAGRECFVVHVGHSRAYLYRNGLLARLTRDQTVAQRVAETGRAAPTELAAHDLRHILTDAIGGHGGEAHVEIENYPLLDGDTVLLCTNGLTDAVSEERIAELLQRQATPMEQCRTLVDLALEHGGPDNVTALVARYRIPE